MELEKLNAFMESYEIKNIKTPVIYYDKQMYDKDSKIKNIRFYWNAHTCKSGSSLNDVLGKEQVEKNDYNLIKMQSKTIHGAYVDYIEEFDAVIIGMASFNARAVKETSERRTWERFGEIIIDRGKNIYYKNWGYTYKNGYCELVQKGNIEKRKTFAGAIFNISSLQSIDRSGNDNKSTGINGEKFEEYAKTLTEIFPRICSIGANKVGDITKNAKTFTAFLMYKEPVRRSGKQYEKMKEFLRFPLSEIDYRDSYDERSTFIQKVKDGICVIRTTIKDDTDKKIIDTARIYVTKSDIVMCRPTNAGDWVVMPKTTASSNWNFKVEKFDKSAIKDTKLEYYSHLCDKVSKKYKGKLLWIMLTNPIFEQIAKAGGESFSLYKIKTVNQAVTKQYLSDYFGGISNSQKLTEALGVNKRQLKIVLENLNNWAKTQESSDKRDKNPFFPYMLRYIKDIFDDEYRGRYTVEAPRYINISYLDDNTFDFLVKSIDESFKKSCNSDGYFTSFSTSLYAEALSVIRITYGTPTMLKMAKKLLSIVGTDIVTARGSGGFGGYVGRQSALITYIDFLSMVRQLSDGDERPVSCDFNENDPESIVEIHNAAVEAFNAKRDKIIIAKFDEVSKKWDKWIFEDEDFLIDAPKTPNDLINEGIELHHCVGSYISRVSSGSTNILFLRKKESKDEPYFTIEITNDGSVQQVHGACNKNLEKDSKEEKFIKKWINEKKLKETNYNKVR